MKWFRFWVNKLRVILLVFLLSGCRKDTPVVEQPSEADTLCHEDWCDDIPPEPGLGYSYIKDGPQYLAPCFNPNNSNEFVYLRTGTAPVAELVKYDLTTNTETVICNSVNIATPPEWGKSGWITFSTIQKKVWKVYQDGSQLTQLTFGVDDLFPYFSFEGDRIFYDRGISYSSSTLQQNPELYKEHKIIVIDLNGNELDSVMNKSLTNDYTGVFSYQTWWMAAFDQGVVYFNGGTGESYTYGIYKLSFQDNLISPVIILGYPDNDGSWLLDFDQLGNFVYYTRQRDGLYKFDIQSGTNVKIRFGCGTRYYDHISVSEDGKKLLVEKINMEAINCCEVDEQREIWLLDLEDGCEMIQILGE